MTNIRSITMSTLASVALVAGALAFAPAATASEAQASQDTARRAGLDTSQVSASGTALPAADNSLPESTYRELEAAIYPIDRVFNGGQALREGVSPNVVDDFATGWTAAGNRTVDVTVDALEIAAIQSDLKSTRSCVGKNSPDITGLQYNYYLNSCNSNKLLGAIAAGAGAAAIAAIIMSATGVGGAVAGIISGALTVAGGVIAICAANGRGLVAHKLQFVGAVWCNNQ